MSNTREGTVQIHASALNVPLIVCTPDDAYRCFIATEMDALVLEDFVIRYYHHVAPEDLRWMLRHA